MTTRLHRTRASLGAAAALLAAGAAVAVGCSLGLDESKIIESARVSDAEVTPPEAGGGTVEGGPEVVVTECARDEDCAPNQGGCRSARCDVARGRCVVDVCRTAACTYGRCGADQRTCGPAAAHGLLAGSVELGTATLCGAGSLRGCVAAVHPFLFVTTARGEVAAVRANDPGKGAPDVATVSGLGFPVAGLVREGRRLFLYGQRFAEPLAAQQVAVLDVPDDPYAPLEARAALVNVATGVSAVFPMHGAEGQLWVQGDPSGQAGVLALDAGALPARVQTFPLNGAVGGVPIGVSERRLVVQATAADGRVSLGSVANAGTAAGEATALAPVTELAETGPQQVRVPDGEHGQVRLVVNVAAPTDAGPGPSRAVRHAFVGVDARGQLVAEVVQVEAFATAVPAGTPVVGAAAPVDRDTSLVLHAVRDGNAVRAAATLVKRGDAGAPVRVTLPGEVALDRAWAVADGELAYVVVPVSADGGAPTDTAVHVLDLPCTP